MIWLDFSGNQQAVGWAFCRGVLMCCKIKTFPATGQQKQRLCPEKGESQVKNGH